MDLRVGSIEGNRLRGWAAELTLLRITEWEDLHPGQVFGDGESSRKVDATRATQFRGECLCGTMFIHPDNEAVRVVPGLNPCESCRDRIAKIEATL